MKNARRIPLDLSVGIPRWWTALDQREAVRKRVVVPIVLGLVVALALIVRLGVSWDSAQPPFLNLDGVNWDSDGINSQYQNPDERHMGAVSTRIEFPGSPITYFDTDESPLNPYSQFPSYAWGTLPLFLNKGAAELLEAAPLGGPTGGGTWDDYAHIHLVGRVFSTLVDVGSIIVIFLLGSYLFNRRVGLLAAFLLSVTVLHIQYSHYFVVDSFLAFFSLVSIYFAVRAAKEGGRLNFALAGVMFGAAMASKGSALPLALVITMAAGIRAWPIVKQRWAKSENEITSPASLWSKELLKPLFGLAFAGVLAFVVFRVAQPYAFDGPLPWDINDVWRADVEGVVERTSGVGGWPPAVRWIGQVSWLYPLHNMLIWGMGIPLFLAAAGGFLYAAWRVVRRGEILLLLLLTWIAVIFLWQGGVFISYMRYLLPIYPILVLLAAYGLVQLWQATRWEIVPSRLQRLWPSLTGYLPTLGRVTVGAVVVLTLLWAFAFINIYRSPLTRVEASRWINENVPAGSQIANPHWDDSLPLNIDGQLAGENYGFITLDLYDIDAQGNSATLIDQLDRADYVILSSDRLYRSIPRAPAVYPIVTRFFDSLFAEEIGFHEAATFTSFPSLFGVTISDDGAEESFTSYDHPKVLIYEKSDDFSRKKVTQLLGGPSIEPAIASPADAAQNALLLRPDDLETQRNGGTWTDIFNPDSIVNKSGVAWIVWLLPIQILSLALLPVGLYVFRWLPDRGYLLLKPLGLLSMAYLVWLSVSLGLVEFTRGTILGVFLLIVALGIASGVVWRRQVLDFVRQHWRMILLAEAIFLGAFFAFYIVRLHNPDLWHPFRGGEKPLDFALLNAIVRSTTLPPYDPWFAGGYVNYYYFGQFITATWVKLTGILPETAYNLAIPLFFSLAVGAAYSLVYNLTSAVRSRIRRRPGGGSIPAFTLVGAGLLAVLLALVVGNLNAFDQAVDGLSAISPVHLGGSIPVLSGAVGAVGGLWQVITAGAEFPTIDFWRPSRMMPPTISITEFPFFSFLFGDLHAHLMSIPFAVASLGIGLGVVLTGTAEKRPGRFIASGRAISLVILLALTVGALRWTNSWDYPPFLLLGIAAVFISEQASEGRLSWPMAVRAAVSSGLLVILSIVLFYPFQQDYQQFQAGLHGSLETTVLHQYLSHFGLFIVIIVALLAFLWARMLRRTEIGAAARQFAVVSVGLVLLTAVLLILADPLKAWIPVSVADLSAGDFLQNLVKVRIPEGTTPDFPVPLLPFAYLALASVIVLAKYELRRNLRDTPLRLFVLALLAMALGLSIGVDVVNIDGDIQRANTVFKFYIHIWLLLALAAAFGVWYMLAVTRVKAPALKRVPRLQIHRLAMTRRLWIITAVILFVGAIIYPLAATPERLNDRFLSLPPTTNGFAFMQEAVYQDEHGPVELRYDFEGFQWLRNNVDGSPVIIEANTPLYRWGSRYSIYTGLPTVVGWDFHERVYRGKFSNQVELRLADVSQFYSDPNAAEALRILEKYQVSYVIGGELERLYYPADGLAKFEENLGGNLELVYENPGTKIYRVMAQDAAPSFASHPD